MKFLMAIAVITTVILNSASSQPGSGNVENITAIADDDIQRHNGDAGYFSGLDIRETRFTENGFSWHLIYFTNAAKPDGPLWMVPHDDEDAAFDAMMAAIKHYGGTGVTVNSGPGKLRNQAGSGTCGVKKATVTNCDPNRNFAKATPLFTAAFLKKRNAKHPIIALHTNSHGFSGDGQGGRGGITVLDADAFKRGITRPRADGFLAIKPSPIMVNYDTLVLTAYNARKITPDLAAVACRNAMIQSGIHFWHERVADSDGSMSNYLLLNKPDIEYVNAESRSETDLSVSAARHMIMISAYLRDCIKSGR